MTRVRIWAEYEVTDPDEIVRYAKERYRESWGEEWEPDDISEAVMEAVVSSNENPDNARIGLQILDYGHSVVASAQNPPADR